MNNNQNGSNNLAHFGVLGMKWGVRKNQNQSSSFSKNSHSTTSFDGTRTAHFNRLSKQFSPRVNAHLSGLKTYKLKGEDGNVLGEFMALAYPKAIAHISSFENTPSGKKALKASLDSSEWLAKQSGLNTVAIFGHSEQHKDVYENSGYSYKPYNPGDPFKKDFGEKGYYEKQLE